MRTAATTTPAELDIVSHAARLTHVNVEIAPDREPDDTLASRLASTRAQSLHALGPISDTLAAAAAAPASPSTTPP